MKWEKRKIIIKNGEFVEALAPVIISASRATDIPAFYSDWLIQRLKEGYVKWKNPFSGINSYVSFETTRLIVFWSKNPKPIFKHLEYIHSQIPNYYFQFTLNDYDTEKLEPNVPCVQNRIETFIELSDRIGKEKVIWRFDPLFLIEGLRVEDLLNKVEKIGNQIRNYTRKLVFSFADINIYKKVQVNLRKSNIKYHDFTERTMCEFAKGLEQLNKNWNLELGTCAERISLEKFGIYHNMCIDENLIVKLFNYDKKLMNFLGINFIDSDIFNSNPYINKTKENKDRGQREFCGCIISKDIGEYNTCPHLCEYCYANTSKAVVLENFEKHQINPNNETIRGE